MTRSVIDIDVDDARFKKFLDLFQSYKAQLAKMPAEWKAGADAAADVTKEYATMTAALMAQNEVLHTQRTDQDKADKAAAQAGREKVEAAKKISEGERQRQKSEEDHQAKTRQFWRDSATLTGNVARNAASITKHVIGATAKGAALGLLGGGAGLFGLDALANTVSDQRVRAAQLGSTTGKVQAFGLDIGSRLGLGDDFISKVQDVKFDPTGRWKFGPLGISESELNTADAPDLSADVIKGAKRMWDRAGPGGHNESWLIANGLNAFMDMPHWQQIGNTKPEELDKWMREYKRDPKSLGASDPVQEKWQDFSIQMKRAGDQIEAIFVNGLVPLTTPLTDLSVAFEHALSGLLGNPHMKEWIDDLSQGLENAATYLGSEQFNTDLITFVTNTERVARKMAAIWGWFVGWAIPEDKREAMPQNVALPPDVTFDPITGFQGAPPNWGLDYKTPDPSGIWPDSIRPLMRRLGILGTPAISGNILNAVRQVESGGNDDVADSAAGAQGPYQFKPDTWKEFGRGYDVHDPIASRAAADRYLQSLDNKYHDIQKDLAAYNWGPGNVDKAVTVASEDRDGTHRDWLQRSAPAQEYLKKIGDALAAAVKVQVVVTNQTGAHVAVIANGVHQ